jgi:hypothetical protein
MDSKREIVLRISVVGAIGALGATAIAAAALLWLAQRMVVGAYWETHPEEYLKSVAERPQIQATLAALKKRHEQKKSDPIDDWMAGIGFQQQKSPTAPPPPAFQGQGR